MESQRNLIRQPSPAERVAAWEREEPVELRRAADEWEAIGYHAYAEYLRAWAAGSRPNVYVPRPW